MMRHSNLKWAFALVAMSAVLAVVVGAGRARLAQYADPELRALIYPVTEVVTIHSAKPDSAPGPRTAAALFDSTTGAVYSLKGNRGNSSAAVYWQMAIPPVGGTSGLLALQDITPEVREATSPRNAPMISIQQRRRVGEIRDGETFLVDLITGNTWLFRQRSLTNQQIGTWEPVLVHDRGANQTVADLLSKR